MSLSLLLWRLNAVGRVLVGHLKAKDMMYVAPWMTGCTG